MIEVSDRYSAVKLTAALPQLGHEPPLNDSEKLSFVRLLHAGTCRKPIHTTRPKDSRGGRKMSSTPRLRRHRQGYRIATDWSLAAKKSIESDGLYRGFGLPSAALSAFSNASPTSE